MEHLHDAPAKKRSAVHILPLAAKRRKCGVASKLDVGRRGSAVLRHGMIEATVAGQEQQIGDEDRGEKTRKRKGSDENRQSKIARKGGSIQDKEQRRGLLISRALRKLRTVKDAREAESGGVHSLGNVDCPCLKDDGLLGKRKRCEGESEAPEGAADGNLDEEGLSHINKKRRGYDSEQTHVRVLLDGKPKRFVRCKNRPINPRDGKPDDRGDMTNFSFINKGKRKLEKMDSDEQKRRAKKENMKHEIFSEVINKRLKVKSISKGLKWSDKNSQSEGVPSKTKRVHDHYVESVSRKRLKPTFEDERVQHEDSDDKQHLHPDSSSEQLAGVTSNVEYRKRLRKRNKREDVMRKRQRTELEDTEICEKLQHL
ncbi:hypothetical protein O6H91_20G058700 [Diphasiastrum complanatum]|uniref:Uncharacterized protein n=2 Tax=Diphasiastrum complanatum TaxID=34168 RepID=A0ACC2AQT3_DIPCM|nr:hypothetical protein O6H91_20G058700 [Diphasiastrum complanatum]KAJ7519862.1 hypothetical protein O6H91_20G058700 [Diphasiastrum complanatum]